MGVEPGGGPNDAVAMAPMGDVRGRNWESPLAGVLHQRDGARDTGFTVASAIAVSIIEGDNSVAST